MDFSPSEKQGAIDGFERGYQSTQKERELSIQYERQAMEKFAEIISYLETTENSWYVEDNLIVFETDQLWQKFEALATELNLLVQEQENLILRQQLNTQKKLKKLKEDF